MTHYRTTYRTAALAAIRVLPDFTAATEISAWAQSVDEKALPAFAVATPTETKERAALDTSDRATTLAVVVKRQGGDDIEDQLDDDSIVIEAAILAAIETDEIGCELRETQIKVDGDGARRVGTLTQYFTISATLVEPLA